jgi:GH15 family glucan-1,4-alpha-glucosidase
MPRGGKYPPISDYALISDCHSAALVSRSGSIDWCCLPRFDSASVFGRLLDWERGGHCSISPSAGAESSRRYLDGTLVLETTFRTREGEARLLDAFTMREGGSLHPHLQIVRILEGICGQTDADVNISPRFDYGEVRPWVREVGDGIYTAIGGSAALVITGDLEIAPSESHSLSGRVRLGAGERVRLSMQFARPETLEWSAPDAIGPGELDRRLDETIAWWRAWSSKADLKGPDRPAALRSAIVLKALSNAPTGAIIAAPTTSLPETPRGTRNWDYRYSWVRDSVFAVRALGQLGFEAEADGFRRFIERSAAGSAEDLLIMYGVGGERRLPEFELKGLSGYRGARPVRVGNAAYQQTQLDIYGHLLQLAWRWQDRGHSPDAYYWRFLTELVETAAARWMDPDQGIWEVRGRKQHFVHSKVMCWAALDCGLRLAKECGHRVPDRRWRAARKQIRETIETRGYDRKRGVFVRAFGSRELDASALLIPSVGFVNYDDERMVRTVDAIRQELSEGDLLARYRTTDGLPGREGVFLACSFWLAECLAMQARWDEARQVFDRATSAANDVGLFSEELDVRRGEMLGNFPQGLTHLSLIAAAVALAGAPGVKPPPRIQTPRAGAAHAVRAPHL